MILDGQSISKPFTKDGGRNSNRFWREQPKWDLLTQQVKAYKGFVYEPKQLYQPYQILADAVLCSGLTFLVISDEGFRPVERVWAASAVQRL